MKFFSRLSRTRRNASRRSFRNVSLLQFERLEHRSLLATFTVINTDDSGTGSLRQAILEANTNSGTDSIEFNIGGGGLQTITPGATAGVSTGLGGLPTITDPVTIDGYTQPGASPNTNGPSQGINAVLRIELRGSFAGNANALTITGGGSTVRGLVINRFTGDLVSFQSAGGNRVEGSFIGTNVSGTLAMGSPLRGVLIIAGSSLNIIGTNGDGVSDGAERNLISGNIIAGVGIGGSTGNVIAGNLIGTDVTGTSPLNSAGQGIILQGTNANRIGTDGNGVGDDWERNVISGNSLGIGIVDLADQNIVAGNLIGTDVTGLAPVGNIHGVGFSNAARSNQVGGGQPVLANTIAFNTGSGVFVLNRVAGPPDNGPSTGNRIQGNSLHSNGLLGIDLDARAISPFSIPSTPNQFGDGVTLNDSAGHIGPNNLQNFPVITAAVFGPATTTVTGTLNSTSSASFTLDFYASPDADSSGYGEGKYYIGSTTVMTDGSGNTPFNVPLTTPATQGDIVRFITATATDVAGNTSEFSQSFNLDSDGDGIANAVDLLPLTFSNDFSDGTTSGTITNRGAQHLTIVEAPDVAGGILIDADLLGGATPATISVDNGVSILSLSAGDRVIVTHGSVILDVLAGTVEATFVADSGQVATGSLTAGNQLTFKPESFVFIAPATNTQTVHVVSGANEISVEAGTSVRPVQIDVTQGPVNLASNGVIAVTILSTSGFNASQVNVGSVLFAGAHATQGSLSDVNGDGRLDLVLKFHTRDTNLRMLYEQLLADDINADGVLDSNQQTATVKLSGETVDHVFFQGSDTLDLLLSGKKLRDLLDQLAAAGAI